MRRGYKRKMNKIEKKVSHDLVYMVEFNFSLNTGSTQSFLYLVCLWRLGEQTNGQLLQTKAWPIYFENRREYPSRCG